MKNLLLFLAAAFVIASCSKNPSEPVPEAPTMKVPGVGSSYIYDTYGTDEAGDKIPGSDAELVENVVASNVSFGGKTGVWAIEASTDTTYYCIDANKDVLIYAGEMDGLLGSMKWLRYPVTSGTAQKDSIVTTQDFNGISVELTIVVVTKRVGEEQLAVGTSGIKTVKLTSDVAVTAKAFGQVVNESTLTSTVWYAPSLGTMIRRVTPAQDLGGELQEGNVEMLKSYSLK